MDHQHYFIYNAGTAPVMTVISISCKYSVNIKDNK